MRVGSGSATASDPLRPTVYVFNDEVRLAIRVARATGRPLLVRGAPGWGKSSLAKAASSHLGWDFRSEVITSRTQARDLLWQPDLLLRLNDAQAQKLDQDWAAYIRPGVLWWAFDPPGAERQAARYARRPAPAGFDAAAPPRRTVVLLDEIDKADPDVPNNLLVPLGDLTFEVEELGITVRCDPADAPLVIITTNEERDLPAAFLRRCVELRLPAVGGPDDDGAKRRALLLEIGTRHFESELGEEAVRRIADGVLGNGGAPAPEPGTEAALPSPAEFLDTLRAAATILGPKPAAKKLEQIAAITLWKHGRRPPESR